MFSRLMILTGWTSSFASGARYTPMRDQRIPPASFGRRLIWVDRLRLLSALAIASHAVGSAWSPVLIAQKEHLAHSPDAVLYSSSYFFRLYHTPLLDCPQDIILKTYLFCCELYILLAQLSVILMHFFPAFFFNLSPASIAYIYMAVSINLSDQTFSYMRSACLFYWPATYYFLSAYIAFNRLHRLPPVLRHIRSSTVLSVHMLCSCCIVSSW